MNKINALRIISEIDRFVADKSCGYPHLRVLHYDQWASLVF